jgi:hypothetical protein
MDKFMDAASTVFPSTVIQHEDFYSEAAFDFLERYQNKYRMFNDDIQGYVPVFWIDSWPTVPALSFLVDSSMLSRWLRLLLVVMLGITELYS